jgi:hypothetical protein
MLEKLKYLKHELSLEVLNQEAILTEKKNLINVIHQIFLSEAYPKI